MPTVLGVLIQGKLLMKMTWNLLCTLVICRRFWWLNNKINRIFLQSYKMWDLKILWYNSHCGGLKSSSKSGHFTLNTQCLNHWATTVSLHVHLCFISRFLTLLHPHWCIHGSSRTLWCIWWLSLCLQYRSCTTPYPLVLTKLLIISLIKAMWDLFRSQVFALQDTQWKVGITSEFADASKYDVACE